MTLNKNQMESNNVTKFAEKISNHLQSSDYKNLNSLDGVINLLKGYGYPLKENEVNENNWEEIYNILTEI